MTFTLLFMFQKGWTELRCSLCSLSCTRPFGVGTNDAYLLLPDNDCVIGPHLLMTRDPDRVG